MIQTAASDIAIVDGGSTITCEHVRVIDRSSSATAAASSIHCSFTDKLFSIDNFAVDSLYIPDTLFLSEPARDVSLTFSPASLSLKIPAASIILLGNNVRVSVMKSLCDLPFGVGLSVEFLRISSAVSMDDKTDMTMVKGMVVAFRHTDGSDRHFQTRVKSLQKRWLKMFGCKAHKS